MRWSLNVLDVRLLFEFDASVVKFLVGDHFEVTSAESVPSLPVPGHSACELQASHFFVRQVRDDLERVATISIVSEDIILLEVLHVGIVAEQVEENESGKHVAAVVHVVQQNFVKWCSTHFYFINYNNEKQKLNLALKLYIIAIPEPLIKLL